MWREDGLIDRLPDHETVRMLGWQRTPAGSFGVFVQRKRCDSCGSSAWWLYQTHLCLAGCGQFTGRWTDREWWRMLLKTDDLARAAWPSRTPRWADRDYSGGRDEWSERLARHDRMVGR